MALKIALFTDTYTPDVNGVAKTLERWVTFLQREGHEIQVFAPEAKTKNAVITESAVTRYKSFPFFLYPELQAALPNPLDMKQRLNDFEPDIIHVATPFNLGLYGRRYALKRDIPFVASYHTNLDQYLTSYNLEWAESFLNKYMYWFHKDCERVYAPSMDTAQGLIDQEYPNVELWKRGVEADLFQPMEEHKVSREEVFARYHLDEEKFTILYVGRLATEKSLDVLVDTVQEMSSTMQAQSQVVLVGDGPMRKELEKLTEECTLPIHLLGFKNGVELAEIYAAADVFFFPSSTETFGNVVLEALASGVPVIGANAGGVTELVSSGTNGILCEPRNIPEFTQAIEKLYNEEFTRIAYGEHARDYALTQSWETIFNDLLSSYKSVVSSHAVLSTN